MLADLRTSEATDLPIIDKSSLSPIIAGRYFWDHSPVFDSRGNVFRSGDSELWTGLSAPVSEDPVSRHDHARLRLVKRRMGQWIDCGNILPDQFSHGSRDWAGVMCVDNTNAVSLYYTATGTFGEKTPTYRQRIFEATAVSDGDSTELETLNWRDRGEPIRADGNLYEIADQAGGAPGAIKSFRDPFYFIDPETDHEYLLFAASDGLASTAKNGAVGIARKSAGTGQWVLQKPLVTADGVSNEMERPNLVYHKGGYYLFWSVHAWTFADGIQAPTGLYGMYAKQVQGPYEPLNGNGLAAANPPEQPFQAYSWLVLNDLRVISFVDMLDGRLETHPGALHYPVGQFQGTEAPTFHIELNEAASRFATHKEEGRL